MKKEAENKRLRMPPVDEKTAESMKILAGFGFEPEVIGEKCGGYSGTVVRKLSAVGFDIEKYRNIKREENKVQAQRKQAAEEPETAEELPGQIEMDLTTVEKPEMSEQTKMMRFQAGQVERLAMKLDKLNDTLCMILRAIRRE